MEATALWCYLWSRSTWVESHTNQLLGEDDINTSRFPHCIEHRPSFDSNVSSISLNDTLTMWLWLAFFEGLLISIVLRNTYTVWVGKRQCKEWTNCAPGGKLCLSQLSRLWLYEDIARSGLSVWYNLSCAVMDIERSLEDDSGRFPVGHHSWAERPWSSFFLPSLSPGARWPLGSYSTQHLSLTLS